jgi:hypothetical protein
LGKNVEKIFCALAKHETKLFYLNINAADICSVILEQLKVSVPIGLFLFADKQYSKKMFTRNELVTK